jgi:endonuclease/exonuclease/phosphatase family metal-dependent hydrolase
MRARGHKFLSMVTSLIFKKQILILALGVSLVCLLYQPGVAGERFPFHFGPPVKVMTQNLYFGADIHPVVNAPAGQIPFVIANIYKTLLQTDFPARAKALAEEIARVKPDLIGLQEVALYRTQSPGDFLVIDPNSGEPIVQNPYPNAEQVLFDYLQILLGELKARHLHYKVAAIVQDTDVELPMFDTSSPTMFTDVRLTDHDVILVKGDIHVSYAVSSHYTNNLEFDVGGLPVVFKRGYIAVNAKVQGKTYRFVNTHLEERTPPEIPIQALQAQELIGVLANEKLPVILVGDLNSSPEDLGIDTAVPPYTQLRDAGYADLWERRLFGPDDAGLTCCQSEALDNPASQLYERIDYIFVRNQPHSWPETLVGPLVAYLVGDEPEELAPDVFWASDHAGVVARMLIPTFK